MALRGRCRDDRGVDDGPGTHDPALTLEDLVLCRELLPELVGFEEVAEGQQHGRVRDLLHGEVQTHEPAHRTGVVDRVLHALIGQGEPRLQQIHRSVVAIGLAFRPVLLGLSW